MTKEVLENGICLHEKITSLQTACSKVRECYKIEMLSTASVLGIDKHNDPLIFADMKASAEIYFRLKLEKAQRELDEL